ncbi:MAG: hypothetical protein J4F39_01610 [Candidatus Latescibacteria bacterium]|nr:hypothetical protein [Candidatus Latescibacterota bacterium]
MDDNRKGRPDKAGNVVKCQRALYAACALLLAADLVIVRHGHIAAEEWFGFHAWYGFAACVALVLIAQGLRMILGRKEDYYD